MFTASFTDTFLKLLVFYRTLCSKQKGKGQLIKQNSFFKVFKNTLRNKVLPTIWAFLGPVKLTQEINHHIALLPDHQVKLHLGTLLPEFVSSPYTGVIVLSDNILYTSRWQPLHFLSIFSHSRSFHRKLLALYFKNYNLCTI